MNPDTDRGTNPTIHSVGYSRRTLDELVTMLKNAGVTHLADVRSHPSSRREEFDGNHLRRTLPERGIQYTHHPGLGGLRDQPYEEYRKTSTFLDALSELETIATDTPTAFLCLERDPADCHRRHIATALREQGWTVTHLVDAGHSQTTL